MSRINFQKKATIFSYLRHPTSIQPSIIQHQSNHHPTPFSRRFPGFIQNMSRFRQSLRKPWKIAGGFGDDSPFQGGFKSGSCRDIACTWSIMILPGYLTWNDHPHAQPRLVPFFVLFFVSGRATVCTKSSTQQSHDRRRAKHGGWHDEWDRYLYVETSGEWRWKLKATKQVEELFGKYEVSRWEGYKHTNRIESMHVRL